MKILAFDASRRGWSFALGDARRTCLSRPFTDSRALGRDLIPQLAAGFKEIGWRSKELDLIGVTRGPGAFTGIRVALTAAKTLAYAAGCRLVACGTLELLAAQAAAGEGWPIGQVCDVVMDTHRKDFFAARYRVEGAWRLHTLVPVRLVADSDLAGSIAAESLVTGAGAERLTGGEAAGEAKLPPGVRFADRSRWEPEVERLLEWARVCAARGETADPLRLVPDYGRPSYADER